MKSKSKKIVIWILSFFILLSVVFFTWALYINSTFQNSLEEKVKLYAYDDFNNVKDALIIEDLNYSNSYLSYYKWVEEGGRGDKAYIEFPLKSLSINRQVYVLDTLNSSSDLIEVYVKEGYPNLASRGEFRCYLYKKLLHVDSVELK